ncbi:MAG: hypothetical protein JWO80_3841, partial [Bryobacterales bacterium]|nr:hypothetical protein [Bryobacterales bacterium]
GFQRDCVEDQCPFMSTPLNWQESAGREGDLPLKCRSAVLFLVECRVMDLLRTEQSACAASGGVASYLKHPLGGGMFGQTGESDAVRFQMKNRT